jgi:hypothetical protein
MNQLTTEPIFLSPMFLLDPSSPSPIDRSIDRTKKRRSERCFLDHFSHCFSGSLSGGESVPNLTHQSEAVGEVVVSELALMLLLSFARVAPTMGLNARGI